VVNNSYYAGEIATLPNSDNAFAAFPVASSSNVAAKAD
jgi:hypothetical protein